MPDKSPPRKRTNIVIWDVATAFSVHRIFKKVFENHINPLISVLIESILHEHNYSNDSSSQSDNRKLLSSSSCNYIDTGYEPKYGQDVICKSYV